jgi:hypothetical protein
MWHSVYPEEAIKIRAGRYLGFEEIEGFRLSRAKPADAVSSGRVKVLAQ